MVPKWFKHWKIIYDSIPEQKIGRFEIVKDGGNTSLVEHSDSLIVWMSMDENEWHLYNKLRGLAYGKVLIAGLGLGFDLLNVADKSSVNEIVVVEKRREVIDFVWPYISHDKTTLIHKDILEYLHDTGEKFNIIYFDIFPGGSDSFPEQMDELCEIAKIRLKFGGQIIFWQET